MSLFLNICWLCPGNIVPGKHPQQCALGRTCWSMRSSAWSRSSTCPACPQRQTAVRQAVPGIVNCMRITIPASVQTSAVSGEPVITKSCVHPPSHAYTQQGSHVLIST